MRVWIIPAAGVPYETTLDPGEADKLKAAGARDYVIEFRANTEPRSGIGGHALAYAMREPTQDDWAAIRAVEFVGEGSTHIKRL